MEKQLTPKFASEKSFYKKAMVTNENGEIVLRSYGTPVARIKGGVPQIRGLYSKTTTRHIKEFLQQHNVKADSTKEIKKFIKQSWD